MGTRPASAASAPSVERFAALICPPTTSRQLQWDKTRRGSVAVQTCPIGATGHAKWACQADGTWASPTPDMSHCKSVAMANLESQVSEGKRRREEILKD